jgi:uncharacterized protein (DUF342 family)
MILVQNEYFSITETEETLFIQVFKLGFSIRDFQIIMEKYPRIAITKFLVLREALENGTSEEIEFGKLKSKINLTISSDYLEAKIHISLEQHLYETTKQAVNEEILQLLKEKGITYGILYDVINKELKTQKDIIVAKGVLPKDGTDAIVAYLEMPEKQPALHEDGRTNYYDMNLFKYIHKGDWLGEKQAASPGVQGMNIKGERLPGKQGKDKQLRFDESSVEATQRGDKIILLAKTDGALQIKEGRIGVVKHLIISGDIGNETGNIDFDGSVTVKGTIEDGFSVVAEHDISILGEMGLGAVDKVYSKSGSIYVKGGISGKGKSLIEARGGSVFVKYVNACTIKAKDTIDIGYYALDSELEGGSIFVQAKHGRTIGGTIRAKTKVSLRMVGNIYEKETYINVEGFDRKTIKKKLDDLLVKYKELLIKAEQNERELRVYENTLTQFGRIKSQEDYKSYHKIHQVVIDEIYSLEEQRKELLNILSSKGEGQVTIYEKAYPRTLLQIKNIQKRIKHITTGTFYAQDNQMMFD